MKSVEFIFDFSSPNSYVAFAKLKEMKNSLEIIFSPMYLGGLFKLTGDAPVPIGTHEFNYMENNLRRISSSLGIGFHFPHERFPVHSLSAIRGYYFAESLGKAPEYVDRVFQACWADDQDMSDANVLRDLVRALGFDPQE